MSRNATSSWSGYAHQGKIGLLVALRKINALLESGEQLNGYSVTFETREDVAILRGGTVIEVHQVKAYMTSDTIGSYTDALEIFEACNGDHNYLHTIVEIRNWQNLTSAQNPASVRRYPYSAQSNYCSLDDIFNVVDAEIWKLLKAVEHAQANNESWRASAFQEFLAALDEKIRLEHFQHNILNQNVQFTLDEITSLVRMSPVRQKSKITAIRKKLYKQYEQFIADLEHNELTVSDAHERKIEAALRSIYSLDDDSFIKFLYNINPHKTDNEKFESCEVTDPFFEEVSFYSTFLMTLTNVTDVDCSLDSLCVPKYFKSHNYLLTAISGNQMMKKFFAMRILKNDHVNFTAYESDYIITESYEGTLSEAAGKLIPGDSTKFISKKNMSFIQLLSAAAILNQQ